MKHRILTLGLFLLGIARLPAASTDDLLKESSMSPDGLISHLHELGLTPEQEQKIKKVVTDAHVRADSLNEVLREKQRKFTVLMQDPATRTEVATAQLGDVLESEAVVKMLMVTTLLDVRHLLTPAQITKALDLAKAEVEQNVPLEKRMSGKADKLRAAFRWLGNDPPAAFRLKGDEIEKLVKAGNMEQANVELDTLIEDAGLNEAPGKEAVDFSKADPGNMDLDALVSRFEAVKTKAQATTSVPVLRQIQRLHEEFESARSVGDAARIGRVLTLAEGILEIKG